MEAEAKEKFPWGDRNPEGGYKPGDQVGVIHSDHETYIFDEPLGTVVEVDDAEDDDDIDYVTVDVRVHVPREQMYLVKRKGQ